MPDTTPPTEPDNVLPFNRAPLEAIEIRAHTDTSAVVAQAHALAIVTPEDFVAAAEFRKEINRRDALLEAQFKPIKQGIDKVKATVLDFERKARGGYGEALAITDDKMLTWKNEQNRIREEAEVKLREVAKRAEEDRRLREAENAVAAGVPQEDALEALGAPSTSPPPSLPSSVPKVKGLSFSTRWEAEVLDLYSLVCFAAMHKELLPSLILPNQPGLNALARSQKGALSIDGVRAVEKSGVSGSRT